MSEKRVNAFKRNEELEKLLLNLNVELQPSETNLVAKYINKSMRHPLVFVMGPLRSGTTLFTQWLADTGLTAYPTNLLSRFYQAPIIGAKIQLLLTDERFNFRDELSEFFQQNTYESENGKTKGALSPNEFWYFWRRFLEDSSRDVWSDSELRDALDVVTMKAELTGMMDVFEKPFAAKGMLFNYNIPFFDTVFDKIIFVQIKRDPVTNVASVLEARKRQLGNEKSWYSFKIPEFSQLENLDPVTQVAGQIHYINAAITKGMSGVSESRKVFVQYEDFCDNPQKVYDELALKLDVHEVDRNYSGPNQFDVTRSVSMSDNVSIVDALAKFSDI